MTALCLEIDTRTGVVGLINAGHPFPIMLHSEKGDFRLLSEVKGLPPGFDRRRTFVPCYVQLSPGDCLVLFTDGLVESTDREGRQTGFAGLARLIDESRSPSLLQHLGNIFAAFDLVSEKRQDDCTLLMVRYL